MKTLIKTVGLIMGMATLAPVATAQNSIIYIAQDISYERGMTALESGNYKEARTYLAKAAKQRLSKKQKHQALNNLCAVEFQLGDLSAARETCQKAINISRKSWRTHILMGSIMIKMGQYEQAEVSYNRALALNAKSKVARKALSRLHHVYGQNVVDAR